MNFKTELLKLKETIIGETKNKNIEETPEKTKNEDTLRVNLDDKVDDFIKWYADVKGAEHREVGEYRAIEMRNFIEKVAVWYELRYPTYEINRIMPCITEDSIQVSDEMFNQNDYINQKLDSDSEVRTLDWADFYNTKAFIHSLPCEEAFYFMQPKYQDIVYWNYGFSRAHLHLSKKGTVEMSEKMDTEIPVIANKDLEGKNIREVVEIIKRKGIQIPENNEFVKAIQNYDNWIYQKEEMLNCIMYRIIERGGIRIGPRRAFLFAKEFKRNIDIPMAYGIDYSDPGLRFFMNEYIKSGGSTELVCYDNYFERDNKYEKLNTITIGELIKMQSQYKLIWPTTFYTPEENELHQRMVNAIANRIDKNIIKQEEIKRLRLEKKLKKSKTTKNL